MCTFARILCIAVISGLITPCSIRWQHCCDDVTHDDSIVVVSLLIHNDIICPMSDVYIGAVYGHRNDVTYP